MFHSQNYENQEIHRIPFQIHEDNKNLSIPRRNRENQEIHGIQCQNHENHAKFSYSNPEC